jgi:hypothetical protein
MSKIQQDANGTSTFFGVEEGNVAMLFVPVAVHIDHAPMIVYFHGWSSSDDTPPKSIEEYIGSNPVRDFRPLMKQKKVTLIEPWGGTYSKQFFSAATPLGLPAMLDAAIGQTRPSSLIMVGFSGGGVALRNTAPKLSGTTFSLLSEVWCLDCMYSGEGDEWGSWSRKTGKRLRVGLSSGESSGLPRAQERNIGKGEKITIEHFDCGHEPLPRQCIESWLLDARNP